MRAPELAEATATDPVVKAEGDEDEEEKKEDESKKIKLPEYGYIKIRVSANVNTIIQLKLVDAPTPMYNWFDVYLLGNQRVFMLKEKIIEHHGRVQDIQLFDNQPTKDQIEAMKKKALANIAAPVSAPEPSREAYHNGDDDQDH